MLKDIDYIKEQRRKRLARKKRKKISLVLKDRKSSKHLTRRTEFEKFEAAD